MNVNQFRALIFDLDGVIIDTEALHAEAKRLTFERYGIAVPERLVVSSLLRLEAGSAE